MYTMNTAANQVNQLAFNKKKNGDNLAQQQRNSTKTKKPKNQKKTEKK